MRLLDIIFGNRSRSISATMNSSYQSSVPDELPNKSDLPDTVFCTVEVLGPRLKLNSLKKELQGFDPTIFKLGESRFSHFCLGSVIEIPKEVLAMNSMTVLDQFRISRWGSCSNANGITVKEAKYKLRYHFAVGGVAPLTVFRRIIGLNPSLKFKISINCPARDEVSVIIGRRGQVFQWRPRK